MKTSTLLLGIAAALAAAAPLAGQTSRAAVTTPTRVGVYDSRAVAYAHFWSPAVRQARDADMAAGRAAKAAGDTAGYEAKHRALSQQQDRIHLAVFSNAPADDAMAALAARLPALQQELGVARFVSKWDKGALRRVPEADRVDVTDRLVREFITPDEKQQKVLESMKTKEPVSRWKMKLLTMFGGA